MEYGRKSPPGIQQGFHVQSHHRETQNGQIHWFRDAVGPLKPRKNCTFVHFLQLNHILPIFLRTLPQLTAVREYGLQSFQDSRPDLGVAMSVFLLIFYQFVSMFAGDFRDFSVNQQLLIVRENWLGNR